MLELLLEVAVDGATLDAALERYGEIPVSVYRAIAADTLPVEKLAVIDGDAA
ncbi:MAG: hypothetical protein H0V72_22940 [Bradyrhizobium sp.]|nr:hypothetical protein [Bradyrhizobium sp.]